MQIASKDAHERLLELLVGQRVAERVHRAVGVAKEVGEHVEVAIGARRCGAEAFDQGQNVIWRPAGHECAQDK